MRMLLVKLQILSKNPLEFGNRLNVTFELCPTNSMRFFHIYMTCKSVGLYRKKEHRTVRTLSNHLLACTKIFFSCDWLQKMELKKSQV